MKHFLLVLFLLLLFTHAAYARREMAGQNACVSNLRVIQGAIEMYELDDKSVADILKKDYIKVFVDEGYLKSKQDCPGAYLLIPGILWGQKLINLPVSGSSLEYRIRKNAAGKYEVFCSAHGSYEELNKSVVEYTDRYRRTTGFVGIGLMILLISGIFAYLKVTARQ